MFQHARIDGANFEEAVAEMDRLVQMILDCGCPDRHTLLRTLHTIKGNAGMYGFTSLATLCHELETKIVDTGRGLPDADLDRLAEVWATISDKVQVLIGSTQRDHLEIARADFARLEQAVATGMPPVELHAPAAAHRARPDRPAPRAAGRSGAAPGDGPGQRRRGRHRRQRRASRQPALGRVLAVAGPPAAQRARPRDRSARGARARRQGTRGEPGAGGARGRRSHRRSK